MRKNFKYFRLNYQITAPTLRLLDETGKQIGLVEKNEALKMAQAQQKDLVEIASQANPPVVKLIDFKKFKYLEAKKERENKKNVKHVDIKEIRLSPFIGQHDLDTRIQKAEEFLKEGNQLKITVVFKGREITHKEFGTSVMTKAVDRLKNISKAIKPPHFEGRFLVTILTAVKKQA